MSKMYNLNRMQYAAAAGGGLGTLIGKGIKFVGGLFKSGAAKKAAQTAVKVAKSPMAQTAAMVAAGTAVGEVLGGGGGGTSRGATGSWGPRRRRGITATELRGFRKVANLLHKEGMVVKRARGRH